MAYGYSQPQYAAPQPAYPAYTHQPRRSAPAGVHVVAILQYLGALATLAAAGLAAWLSTQAPADVFTTGAQRIHPDDVRILLLVAAGVLAVIALVTMVVARKLQRGRQWARALVMFLSFISLASVAYSYYTTSDPRSLAGAVLPVLYLLLLSTRAARSWFRAGTW